MTPRPKPFRHYTAPRLDAIPHPADGHIVELLHVTRRKHLYRTSPNREIRHLLTSGAISKTMDDQLLCDGSSTMLRQIRYLEIARFSLSRQNRETSQRTRKENANNR
jgi:hypothetical protein